ncbi:putative membrane protein [Pseudonocardia sediminis]|uniref:Putative membrane protein n=1 Tax=Pseudonocardia sediminis TaxID=1397368 RepID=A0A4V2FQJ6_PSEST|nr:PH domain-containing protein [Pseudonocardia sediminis]RZT84530.1 putative membrane protein [Pseudonocardia sediminis]
MTEPAPAAAAPVAHPEIEWRRLPPKMLVVAPASILLKFIPAFVVVLLFGGSESPVKIWITVAIAVFAVAAGLIRWRTTRYRITPERVELHSGLVSRQRRSVPRDRIRTVDLTSTFLHQMFGLSVVKVGAGQSSTAGKDGQGLDLDAVSGAEAERLRRELLAVPAPASDAPATGPPATRTPETEHVTATEPIELDRLSWSSLRYAPLTVSSLAAVGALAAAGWNLVNEADIDPRTLPGVSTATGELSTAPLWAAIGVGIGLLLLVLVAGALVLFTERWWNFRLTREPDGTLRVRRGLLTQRSLSVSEQRLRGVTVAEPLLVRLVGRGAQAGALSVGLGGSEGSDGGGGALQPPVPAAHAHEVAAVAMRSSEPVTDVALRAHPVAARTRRLTRAVVPALVVIAAAWVLGGVWDLAWLGPVSLVLLPIGVLLALDRYRSLGNRLDERFLVSRQGSLVRSTVALQRDGVIGWRIRQSVFQRRAGVVTLDAITGAGAGAYEILDVDPAVAVDLARSTTPSALDAFVPGGHSTQSP